MYDQRDIVLVPFPYSDLSALKYRPALIISNSLVNKTEDRLCCLVTSQPSSEGILLEIKDFENGKLAFKSRVKPHRIFTSNIRIIKKKLCSVTDDFHNKVLDELYRYLKSEKK